MTSIRTSGSSGFTKQSPVCRRPTREILLMRDIEQMTTAETAQTLDITEGAVKVRLHRARQALRELLDPHMRGEAVLL
jgi:DNA-directed RNA polymerase specialized sigma24 family protein